MGRDSQPAVTAIVVAAVGEVDVSVQRKTVGFLYFLGLSIFRHKQTYSFMNPSYFGKTGNFRQSSLGMNPGVIF